MIDKETIKHIAYLSRLEVKENEMDAISNKIGDVLKYVDQLQSVNTENIGITYNTINLTNALREDEIKDSLDRERVLQNAPEKEMGCFKVPKVLE
jgi:aspartyl-tRNA(Asn)/glutamyl-tRNA(Gln) amidotransferase subunit C